MIELSRSQVLKCLDAGVWCYLLCWKDHRPFPVVTELWNAQRMGVWYGPIRRGQTKTQRTILDFGRYGLDWRLMLPSLRGIDSSDWSFLHDDLAKEAVSLLSYRADCFPGRYDEWYSVYYNQLPKVRRDLRPLHLSEIYRKE